LKIGYCRICAIWRRRVTCRVLYFTCFRMSGLFKWGTICN